MANTFSLHGEKVIFTSTKIGTSTKMKTKELIIICIGVVLLFLVVVKYGYLQCPNIAKMNILGAPDARSNFESITPNACVDMMELGFDADAVNACIAYSNKCDSKNDVWHSPIVAAEVANLYRVLGKDPKYGPEFIKAFGKDVCVNPIPCSSDADCPNFLRCEGQGGGGSACQ